MGSLGSIKQNTRYMQYASALTATLPVSAAVTYVTWSSPTLPKLASDDSPIGIKLTPDELSWVASSFLLGGTAGGLVAGCLIDILGRKRSLLLSAIPLFVPWIAIIFARSAITLCIARLVAGFASTIVNACASIYIGEVAENDIRGRLGTTLQLMNILGGLFVLCVGPFVSYTNLAICCSVIPVVFVVVFYFMPESPYYLVKISQDDAARDSLKRLCAQNRPDNFVLQRLDQIKNTVNYDTRNKLTFWNIFTKAEYRKSLVIMIGIKSLQQLSGTNAIAAYEQTIVGQTQSSISPEWSSVLFGLVQLPTVFVTAYSVDKLGRKPLLITSGLGSAFALTALATYFYIQDVIRLEATNFTWIPTTTITIYLVANTLGILTLPYVLLGELFATNIKSIAVAVFSLYGYLIGFVVTKLFEPITSVFGMHGAFWIYASCCILGVLFVAFVVPETKGKTFAEIQAKLR